MKKPNEIIKAGGKIVFDPEIDYLKGLQALGQKYLDDYMEDSRANQQHIEELDRIDKTNETLKIKSDIQNQALIIQNETLKINKDFKTHLIPAVAGIIGLIIILLFTFGFALAGFKDLALGIGATLIASAAVIAAITGYKNKKPSP